MDKQISKLTWYVFITMILVALIGGIIFFKNTPVEQPIGSSGAGSINQSTTLLATTSSVWQFKVGAGALSQIVVNVLGTGNVVFYDASSTLPAQRTIAATSSLRAVGVIAASQAAGTYTYDVGFYDGLIAVFSGTQGTSTIAWK
jgi:hypothetical protein